MHGLLASVVISLLPAMPSGALTCADGPATCDGAVVALGARDDDDGPVDYATPAEVECPTPPGADGQTGICDPAPGDLFWFRISRLPDSESGGTTVAPGAPSGGRVPPSCGAPPEGTRIAPPAGQPIALFAVPTLVPEDSQRTVPPDPRPLPTRALAPPDRPPRV